MKSPEFMKKVDLGMKVAFYESYNDPNNPLNIIGVIIRCLMEAKIRKENASKDK